MTLQQELSRVRTYLTDTSNRLNNEANTCSKVIAPILHACGYGHDDYQEQSHDNAGHYPDYEILPDTDFTWFLEAKKWQEKLTEVYVNQALNYAHTKYKRWVVLTNGNEWRLYDDHIIGNVSADRLIVKARLDCPNDLEELLTALSIESVKSGELEQYALRTRLSHILKHEMNSPNCNIFALITSELKKMSGLSKVEASDVALYFQKLLNDNPSTYSQISLSVNMATLPQEVVMNSNISEQRNFSLLELKQKGKEIKGRDWAPKSITFPNGTMKETSNWSILVMYITEWLFNTKKIPTLPFLLKIGRNDRIYISKSSFMNEEYCKTFENNGTKYYVRYNDNVWSYLIYLNALCDEVSEPASGFIVAF